MAALWTLRRVAPRRRTPKLSDFENVTIEARQIEDFREFFGYIILLKKDSDDACTFQLTRLLSVSPQFMQYAEASIEYKGHDGSPSS